MIASTIRIDTISTLNESEALLLEANLIKKNKPRYNVLLKMINLFRIFKSDQAITIHKSLSFEESIMIKIFTLVLLHQLHPQIGQLKCSESISIKSL